MADRYWVPTSLPCRMPCVGSCASKNTLSNRSKGSTDGSKTARTTSACPVSPEQTSSYVGYGVKPPAYPTAVVHTPSVCQNSRSAPQKHPNPSTAVCKPAGNGGLISRPVTKCVSGTGNA